MMFPQLQCCFGCHFPLFSSRKNEGIYKMNLQMHGKIDGNSDDEQVVVVAVNVCKKESKNHVFKTHFRHLNISFLL